jgi:hypothetical protein
MGDVGRYILWKFGLFLCHFVYFVYFVVICYILWLFVIAFPFWYVVPRKIWQPRSSRVGSSIGGGKLPPLTSDS